METLLNLLSKHSKRDTIIIAILLFLFAQAANVYAYPNDKAHAPVKDELSGWNMCWDGKIKMFGSDEDNESVLTLACKPHVNVSLGQQGYAILTALLLVNAPAYPANQYVVDIMGPLTNTVYCEQLGQELMVMVTELPTGNSCMSTVLVEDKLPPVLICTSDTLPCNTNIPSIDFESLIESVTDNCDTDPTLWYAYTVQNLPCNPNNFTQQISVIWTATDNYGNSSTCEDVIFLKKPSLGQIVFPPNVTVSCVNPNIDPSVTG